MKILLTTRFPDIESEMDPRFGRGANFLIVDADTMTWQALPNPAISTAGGAGIRAAQFVADQKCEAVISGDFGPNAYHALKSAGVSMYQFGTCRTAQEAIQRFKSGQIERLEAMPERGRRQR
jgi:predicted Fe-Mo cluster-binding NifX family protein